jgi:arginyl-tRNA synthetase
LDKLCIENDFQKCKKAELITYWLRDYRKYLEFEEKFTPKKLKEYNRGDIIKVNFGFNLGNEEGGLHYAIVVDNRNAQASGVITVVPLSSIKKQETISKYDVDLGNELHNLMQNKINLYLDMNKKDTERIKIEIDRLEREVIECQQMKQQLDDLKGSKEK